MPSVVRPALILVVGILAFSNSLSNPMLLDDFETIAQNPQIRSLTQWDVLMPDRELPVAGRPLANLSFALNYAAVGQAVRAYHLTNLALHLLCALAAFALVKRVLRLESMPASVRELAESIALTTALVWVVHPLNSEVVNYLTQRTESMMALFFLLTLYGSIRAIDASDHRWTVLAALSCALGALCKESIATAPLAVLAFDRLLVFSSWRGAWQRRRGFYLALASSWLVLAALQSTAPRPLSAGFGSGISVWTYLANQAVMIVQYLWLAVWPRDLIVLYGLPQPLSVLDVVPQGLTVLALLAATAFACRRWPPLGFAGVWLFLTLAPTSSILPIATEVGAERRMYLPLVAIATLLACAIWQRPRSATISTVLVAVLTLGLGATTFARNREYAEPLAMAELNLARWPTGMAHQLVAEELLRAGRKEEALPHLRTAVRDTPRARFTLGVELYKRGQLDEAVAELESFVRLEPLYILVPDAQAMIASAYAQQGRWDDAARVAREALAKAPGLPDALLVVAAVDFRQSRFVEAIAGYRRYLAARPSDADATTNLAIALLASGQTGEGVMAFRRVVEIDPSRWQARRNLAQALLDSGRPIESVEQSRQAIALRPNDAASHTLLGQGLAGVGQLDTAAAEFERALQLDPNDADARSSLEQLRRRR